MIETGQWTPRQSMGRRWAVGCVALEITQRCNLDCTLCYLSDHSEAVKDIPLEELWRRIDMIRELYGPQTNVQVTGGDPTLRKRSELVEIVRRIRERDLWPALFTNGIKATRDLLEELAAAGLADVAFHVDTTQERKGYDSEAALNEIRRDYVERARGLGLAVYFNTTIHDGNFAEIPELVRFFVENSDGIDLASFQLQADTGRGTQRARGQVISIETVADHIKVAVDGKIDFDGNSIGHSECNRYAMTAVANGRVYDLFEDKVFVEELLDRTANIGLDRTRKLQALKRLGGFLARNPGFAARAVGWMAATGWRMRHDLFAARGKATKLSFFIHNFMDAENLECDRVDACSFKVATGDGPVSMCVHNAKRDAYILKPIRMDAQGSVRFWDPLTGHLAEAAPTIPDSIAQPRKLLKGRLRAASEEEPVA